MRKKEPKGTTLFNVIVQEVITLLRLRHWNGSNDYRILEDRNVYRF